MKILTHCVLLVALLPLSGCAGLGAYKIAAVNSLAEANDTARDDAEFVICRGISVGAWVRSYGADTVRAAAWRALCHQPMTELPAQAP